MLHGVLFQVPHGVEQFPTILTGTLLILFECYSYIVNFCWTYDYWWWYCWFRLGLKILQIFNLQFNLLIKTNPCNVNDNQTSMKDLYMLVIIKTEGYSSQHQSLENMILYNRTILINYCSSGSI